jgi:ATP-dependent Clp protease ATP-binding subunit ClpA
MDNIKFNHSSMRSEKARISVMFTNNWLIVLKIVVVVLLINGIFMLVFRSALGWAFVGLSAIPAMIVEWYNGELKHIPSAKNPKTIDDVLSGEILGRLSKNPSPREVATIVSKVPGGYFFAVRFGIGSQFLQELTSADSAEMQKVWAVALDLQKQTNSKNISGAILIVAMLRCAPNYQTLISHLQLDDSDLLSGIEWYNHLRELIERHRAPKRTGGVARDWSFGWTPLLNRFGLQMGGDSTFQLVAHQDSLNQLMGIFSKNGRQNVVLVGAPGVGKTEIVNAFAARLMDAKEKLPKNLQFRQVFNLDAASLIAAAPDRGGLEQLIPQVLGEAYSSKNIIICLDNAQLFFEDGIGSVDITNVLLPILKAGNLRMILTVDEQRFLQISKQNPELANALNRIVVPPANRDETLEIMKDQTIMIEFQNNVTFMYQAIVEAYRLGDRYVHDQAMPGKAIKLLESSANYAENGLVTAESVRQSIEKTMDIKVSLATDTDEREKLLNLEELIHGRMINQVRAVKVVSDALRRAGREFGT